ncbi:cation transporter [Phenylobacterium sp.]|uniref:cation transporter n=1 Tax=Phenylobacterium sp. TaxID=1871053 RepID=UPI00391B242E
MVGGGLTVEKAEQRRVLAIVLGLNLFLAGALAISGVIADSSALIANALDNLSDSAVYTISFYAVGRSVRAKMVAARVSGIVLLAFAALVLTDVGRRLIMGAEPIGPTMIAMALVAAIINLISLRLLKPLKGRDVNLRAAETFSLNDFAANAGIVVAGALVAWTGRPWPDLIVGSLVAAITVKGGLDILNDAKESEKDEEEDRLR